MFLLLLIVRPSMAEVCIVCNNTHSNLVTCCDTKSWATLYRAAVLRDHKVILRLSSGENDLPRTPVKYHRSCRSEFTHKRDLQAEKSAENNKNDPPSRKSSRDASQEQSAVLPDCIFCNKTKYKPNTKTRETMHSVQELRADEMVRKCA